MTFLLVSSRKVVLYWTGLLYKIGTVYKMLLDSRTWSVHYPVHVKR